MKRILLMITALASAVPALAQTPAQMDYERQQREYWRQQEQQRQEQQRQQQLMQDNARRQQEESARFLRPNLPQNPGETAAPMGGGAGGGGTLGGPAGAQLEQSRQAWLKRPPLPSARNPLLGAWTRAQARVNAADPFAQLGALMKGGLCEMFFSADAVFEFRPGALVGIDKRTHQAQTLDQVEYRGDALHVAVIPRATLKLILFDFDGPDRIRWSGQNCTLNRVAGQGAAKAR
jgi:hypothetical protein